MSGYVCVEYLQGRYVLTIYEHITQCYFFFFQAKREKGNLNCVIFVNDANTIISIFICT